VASLHSYHRLPSYHKRADWVTLEGAAERLGVSNTVVNRLIKAGTLPAKQVVRYAPWVIEVADVDLPVVLAEVKAVCSGRKLPQKPLGQQEIPL
jgi:excisionase family DNA binding protein